MLIEKLKEEIIYYLKQVGDTTSYYPGASENLNELIETDNYDQINELSCNTPFLVSDIDLEKEYANKENLVTFGVVPSFPSTGYGLSLIHI